MSTYRDLMDAVVANPHDRFQQLIMADYLDESESPSLAGVIRDHGIYWNFVGGGDGGGGGGGGGVGGDGGDGGDGGGGDGGGGGGGGGGGDGGGGGGGGGPCSKSKIPEGFAVNDGLYIFSMPGGWYPWVLVGWAERDDLFIKFQNCRVIRRYGSRAQLSVIAKKGPQRDTELLEPSELELIPVTSISRAIICDEEAWKVYCPRPKN